MATLKTVDLKIYIYSGTSGSYADTDLVYELQKEIISGQTNILFEIAEMVRDYIDITFNNDYVSRTIWVKRGISLYFCGFSNFYRSSYFFKWKFCAQVWYE